MKTNLRLLFTLLFVVSVVALRAGTMNDIRVSGTVVSEGDPLPGVSVLVLSLIHIYHPSQPSGGFETT